MILAFAVALSGCHDGVFNPPYDADVIGGPVLTLRGTVTSAADGTPVGGAIIRLYSPGKPFQFPYSAALTSSSVGGSYLLQLPASFGRGDNCEVFRLSARALGFTPDSESAGVLCTSETQEFNFVLTPSS